MEFLDDVQDLGDFIKGSALTCSALDLVEYFRNILAGLAYLHDQGIVHCDIKPGNILIAPKRPALITDFGYAKHFPRPGDPAHKTEITTTLEYAHPDVLSQIRDRSDKNATIAEIPRKDFKKQFDLYALGKTMLEVLRTHIYERKQGDDERSDSFTPYQQQFVSFVAKRLLDGRVLHVSDDDLESDIISGLAKPVMEEIKYLTAKEALVDLEKLLDLYSIEGDVPELNPDNATYVQIPHCRVPLTSRVEAVINHPTFTRLAQVTQLGFVSLIYPGASHTRYEHVLGTFAHCCEYVRALWHDRRNPLFQCLMNREDVELLLVAALLHDIGQYPMAHDLTEVTSEFAHEQFSQQLLEARPSNADESLADLVFGKWGVKFDELDAIWSAKSTSGFKNQLLKSIISGSLECDKIDYVRRDSTHLGVTFGLALYIAT
jgi:serine/threonine protein kinase